MRRDSPPSTACAACLLHHPLRLGTLEVFAERSRPHVTAVRQIGTRSDPLRTDGARNYASALHAPARGSGLVCLGWCLGDWSGER
jgi:hypothetical protein